MMETNVCIYVCMYLCMYFFNSVSEPQYKIELYTTWHKKLKRYLQGTTYLQYYFKLIKSKERNKSMVPMRDYSFSLCNRLRVYNPYTADMGNFQM